MPRVTFFLGFSGGVPNGECTLHLLWFWLGKDTKHFKVADEKTGATGDRGPDLARMALDLKSGTITGVGGVGSI